MLEPGQILEDRYRVIRVLGAGATAWTYLAEDLLAESHFVLKQIKNPELCAKLSLAEFRSLKDLNHPNLPRVYDIYPSSAPFHLKLEYILGSSLRDEWEQYSGDRENCIEIGRQVLSALEYLAERGRIHRDVSPANILIPDEGRGRVRLIDFGVAALAEDAKTSVGTPPYRAPEVERAPTKWTPRCDLYSLGVVLFRLLTGRLPYVVEGEAYRKDRMVSPTFSEIETYGEGLLVALLRACAPNPEDRFTSAGEFRSALERALTGEAFKCDGQELENPFVDELRRTYRNSRIGNPNNRGLESQFSKETYVLTRLDTELLPRIVHGEFSLVLLSGNPGDGKTAFLQRLEEDLKARGAIVEKAEESGWRLVCDNRTFGALYDASESHQGTSADDLLHEVLTPLGGSGKPAAAYTAVVAVNDGRLWSFFERYGIMRYPWVWDSLRPQLEGESGEVGGVLLVDLKKRSAVSFDDSAQTLFTGIFDLFGASERWETCKQCCARKECPIYLNASAFGDAALGSLVRQQLNKLVLAIQLRKERHPTIRDIRSALGYIITHDLGCKDVHWRRNRGESLASSQDTLYFNAVFSGGGGPDLLLDEWAQLDPAVVPTPRLSRFLFFHRSKDDIGQVEELYETAGERSALPIPCDDSRERINSLVRRYFFEGAVRAPDRLPEKSALLPFRYLAAFTATLRQEVDLEQARRGLLTGISRADCVPLEAIRDGLAFRLNESSDVDLIVVKRFDAEEFRLLLPRIEVPGVETVPDSISMQHVSGWPTLEIGLDLFEFIMRCRDGALPGPEEQRALAEDITIFKNQLLARPAEEVFLFERGGNRHRVSVSGGTLVREEVVI